MMHLNPYLFQEAIDQCHIRWYDQEVQAIGSALLLYERARRRGSIRRIWAALTNRACRLLDLDAVERECTIRGRRHAGIQAVSLDRIRGSEGRCRDFDRAFYPLRSHVHDKERWLRIAAVQQMGLALPPVELVRVGDLYFVRDGHHRISVARTRGQRAVDAMVTVWDVAGPLPWEQEAAAGAFAGQPA